MHSNAELTQKDIQVSKPDFDFPPRPQRSSFAQPTKYLPISHFEKKIICLILGMSITDVQFRGGGGA
jgi:hypothetical protein